METKSAVNAISRVEKSLFVTIHSVNILIVIIIITITPAKANPR